MALDLQDLHQRVGPYEVSVAEEDRVPCALAGHVPEAVATPTTPEAVVATLAFARERGLAVVPWGAGTQQGLGAPPTRYDIALSTRGLAALVDYQPDDMTVTVQPGMSIGGLWRILAERSQFLPLDPPRPERATLGGTVAANASGPLRAGFGTARDWLIGATVATPEGKLVRGGARVVKSVAGYDLCKLWTGSLGTLGVLVEMTFKVMPLPEAYGFAAAPLDSPERAECLLAAMLDSDVSPAVLELADARAWQAAIGADVVGPAERFILLTAFFGAREAVDWQLDAFASQAEAAGTRAYPVSGTDGERFLGSLRDYPGEGDLVARLSVRSSDTAALMEAATTEAQNRGLGASVVAHAVSGTVLARVDDIAADAVGDLITAWRQAAMAHGGHAVVLRAPAVPKAFGSRYDPGGSPGAEMRLMASIKAAMDPDNVLNPGRFVGGL
ncbi:MAG: FAD-binding oxidoreductase [Armatimonadetes bacterium]|nr:FAD-binding oxidoreductase [Armatimonadota bacterium]